MKQVKCNRMVLDISGGAVVPSAAGVVKIEPAEYAMMQADVVANFSPLWNVETFSPVDGIFFKRFRLWSPWAAIGATLEMVPPDSEDLAQLYFNLSGSDGVKAGCACLGEWVDVGELLPPAGDAARVLNARINTEARVYFPTPPADAVGRPLQLFIQAEIAHTLPVGGWA